jgi:hypothetical protein
MIQKVGFCKPCQPLRLEKISNFRLGPVGGFSRFDFLTVTHSLQIARTLKRIDRPREAMLFYQVCTTLFEGHGIILGELEPVARACADTEAVEVFEIARI